MSYISARDMKTKQKSMLFSLGVPLLLVLGLFSTTILVSTPASAALTTWQKFVKKKCSGLVADRAEECAANLEKQLKQTCGKAQDTDKYTKCWRKFIRDNGGNASNTSSPFEEEEAPELDGEGSATGEECDTILGCTATGDDCGGVETAIIKCNQNNDGTDVENNGIWGLLLIAINIMTAGVGVLAVGGIVYAAILYTTAEDKADQVKKSTDIITNVVIGLVAFALMYAGLNFLIPGGVFT